jgi:uncharacterized membrane protein YccC
MHAMFGSAIEGMDVQHFRFKNSIKVALGCLLATLVYNWLAIPLGVFSVISLFVLFSLFYDEPVQKGLERLLGAMVFSALGVLCVDWLYNLPLLYYFVVASVFAVLCYQYARKKWPYAMLLGAISWALIVTIGITEPMDVHHLAIGWVLGNALGLLIIALLDYFWPLRSRQQFDLALADFIRQSRRHIVIPSGRMAVWSHGQVLQKQMAQSLATVPLAQRQDLKLRYSRLMLAIERLFSEINAYAELLESLEKLDQAIVSRLLTMTAWAQWLEQIAAAIQSGRPESLSLFALARRREQLVYVLWQARSQQALRHVDDEKVAALIAAVGLIDDIYSTSEKIKQCLVAVYHQPMQPDKNKSQVVSSRSVAPCTLDKEAMHQAVKMAVGLVMVLFLSTFFAWPGAVQAMIAMTVMLAQPNLGRAHQRFTRRFLGVLCGSVLGLLGLVLISHYDYFWFLLLFVCLSMGLCSYLAMGDDRVSYFGIQAGVMVPLVMLFHNGPSVDMSLAISRFVGVLEGAAVAAVVGYVLWPKSPLVVFRGQLIHSLEAGRNLLAVLRGQCEGDLTDCVEKMNQADNQLILDAGYLVFSHQSNGDQWQNLWRATQRMAWTGNHLIEHLDALPPVFRQRFLHILSQSLQELSLAFAVVIDALEQPRASTLLPSTSARSLQRLIRRMRYFGVSAGLRSSELMLVSSILVELQVWMNCLDQMISALAKDKGAKSVEHFT